MSIRVVSAVLSCLAIAGCSCERGGIGDGGPSREDAARGDGGPDGAIDDDDGSIDMDAPSGDAGDTSDAPAEDGPRPDTGEADGDVDGGGESCDVGCGPIERCGASRDGNGIDDDCDDAVDEGCTCAPGTARGCFAGEPALRGIGACADGTMVCEATGTFGPCTGGRVPMPEVCDGADDDCDGTIDDGLAGCATALLCPGSELAVPLRPHALNGTAIYGGAATSWSWTVTCPPELPTCPVPADPTAADTEILLLSSGNYTVRLEVVLADGTTNSCDWIVYARGGGLRVELQWDTEGSAHGDTDVDLHLHRRSIAPGEVTGETDFFTADDCYYLTCKASTYGYDDDALRRRWALPDTTDLSVCESSPDEGGLWESLHGACRNPRLDVDVITCDSALTDPTMPGFCAPENINIDDPPLGEPYRIWVNYYSQHEYVGDTHPSVNVYCFGELRGSFGTNGEVTLTYGDGETSARTHDNWWVADVMFEVDECGRPGCRIVPLGVGVRREATFGPPWSF